MVNKAAEPVQLGLLLTRLREREEAVRQRMEDELRKVRHQIAAVEETMALLRETLEKDGVGVGASWSQTLAGLSHHKALLRIAEEIGTLDYRRATDILIEAGLTRGKRESMAPNVYKLLNNSADFERTAPGQFKRVYGGALLEHAIEEPSEVRTESDAAPLSRNGAQPAPPTSH